DNHTLGDFVRLALKKVSRESRIKDIKRVVTLNKDELRIHKLAALTLFSLQGPIMIHAGQEFARSKIIANTNVPDLHVGTIDENSYNKDNETNYINYEHAEWNKGLFNYYKGLIRLRKQFPQLRKSRLENLTFLTDSKNPFAVGYISKMEGEKDLLVFVNGDSKNISGVKLPDGQWQVLADGKKVYQNIERKIVAGTLKLNPTEGIILIKQ
ncbi:MAG: DUF3459 domain-containing protein, partial [Ignavibacteria bacterium]|nr:DUF3459 domain-containing protein [Ignavibacteria bacterium]